MMWGLAFLLLFTTIVGTGFAFYFKKQWKDTVAKLEANTRKTEQLRNKLLQQTFTEHDIGLNQHLFKNTLNSIQSYAFKTHIALDKLGYLLDFILYDSKNGLISLEEEIEFAKNLIDLNKLRLNPLFNIEMKIGIKDTDSFLHKKKIVPLLTSNFIENAFTHGDLGSSEGFIDVSFYCENGIFIFTVTNKISPIPISKKGGIGNETLHKRLHEAYGDKYKIDTEVIGQNYRAILKIDLND
jgi:LytS/YehU family sensor histidine kinase